MAYINNMSGQSWLFPPSITDLIQNEDAICFLVSEVVNSMDFTELDKKYSGRGHPAYDPRIITKLHIQAAIDGQRSSRKIAKNARVNIVYMFHAGQTTPDFRTISDFRKNNSKIIEEAFKKTVELTINMGITNLGHLSIDGTKQKANASNSKTLKKEEIEDIDNYIKNIVREGIAIDKEEDEKYGKDKSGEELSDDVNTSEKMRKKLKEIRNKDVKNSEKKEMEANNNKIEKERSEKKEKKHKSLTEKIKERFKDGDEEEREEIKEKIKKAKKEIEKSGKDIISWTDPESRFMKNKKGNIEYSYNSQIVVESGSGIIVANDVTQDCNDVNQFKIMIENTEKNIELKEGTEISADNGYYNGENIKYANEKGLDLYVPDSNQAQEMKGKKVEKNPYTIENFKYNEKDDEFICPGGKKMIFWNKFDDNGVNRRIYRGTACNTCEHKDKCTKRKFRTIIIDEYWKDRLKMKEKMSKEESKEKYKTRFRIVEKPFGDIKYNQKFTEFLMRGVKKVKIEFNLGCLAYNLKRIWSFIVKKKFCLDVIRRLLYVSA